MKLTGEYLQQAQEGITWQKKSCNIHKPGIPLQVKIDHECECGIT